jgi:hypothetical protein
VVQLLLPYPLTFRIDCRTSRAPDAVVREHPVVVALDGTVETPHDLESERIAAALGGYLTCLDLVDHAVPALQSWMRLVQRADALPVRSANNGESWVPAATGACCSRHGYLRPEVAFDHARSPSHLATVFGADPDLVRTLVEVACIPEPKGPRSDPEARLWRVGVAPALVARIRDTVGSFEPMSASDVLALLAVAPDLEWLDGGRAGHTRGLARALRRLRGEPDTDVGLAVVDPELVEAWRLTAAVPQWAKASLLPAGYSPAEVELLAEIWQHSVPGTALVLAAWAEHGYRPSVSALGHPDLAHHVVPPQPPSRAAVDRLRADLQGLAGAARITVTDLAIAIRRFGTVTDAEAALRAGAVM